MRYVIHRTEHVRLAAFVALVVRLPLAVVLNVKSNSTKRLPKSINSVCLGTYISIGVMLDVWGDTFIKRDLTVERSTGGTRNKFKLGLFSAPLIDMLMVQRLLRL